MDSFISIVFENEDRKDQFAPQFAFDQSDQSLSTYIGDTGKVVETTPINTEEVVLLEVKLESLSDIKLLIKEAAEILVSVADGQDTVEPTKADYKE